jgi:uncharacterized PurR-regulated membrane protein YhhQ (DUF165 family)
MDQPSLRNREGTMALLVVLAVAMAIFILFGEKLAVVLGFVVTCANFSFPLGLIGLVGVGVSLLFLLTPRHYTD